MTKTKNLSSSQNTGSTSSAASPTRIADIISEQLANKILQKTETSLALHCKLIADVLNHCSHSSTISAEALHDYLNDENTATLQSEQLVQQLLNIHLDNSTLNTFSYENQKNICLPAYALLNHFTSQPPEEKAKPFFLFTLLLSCLLYLELFKNYEPENQYEELELIFLVFATLLTHQAKIEDCFSPYLEEENKKIFLTILNDLREEIVEYFNATIDLLKKRLKKNSLLLIQINQLHHNLLKIILSDCHQRFEATYDMFMQSENNETARLAIYNKMINIAEHANLHMEQPAAYMDILKLNVKMALLTLQYTYYDSFHYHISNIQKIITAIRPSEFQFIDDLILLLTLFKEKNSSAEMIKSMIILYEEINNLKSTPKIEEMLKELKKILKPSRSESLVSSKPTSSQHEAQPGKRKSVTNKKQPPPPVKQDKKPIKKVFEKTHLPAMKSEPDKAPHTQTPATALSAFDQLAALNTKEALYAFYTDVKAQIHNATINTEKENLMMLGIMLGQQACLCYNLEERSLSIALWEETINIFDKLESTASEAEMVYLNYRNLGVAYEKNNQHSQAMLAHLRSIEIRKKYHLIIGASIEETEDEIASLLAHTFYNLIQVSIPSDNQILQEKARSFPRFFAENYPPLTPEAALVIEQYSRALDCFLLGYYGNCLQIIQTISADQINFLNNEMLTTAFDLLAKLTASNLQHCLLTDYHATMSNAYHSYTQRRYDEAAGYANKASQLAIGYYQLSPGIPTRYFAAQEACCYYLWLDAKTQPSLATRNHKAIFSQQLSTRCYYETLHYTSFQGSEEEHAQLQIYAQRFKEFCNNRSTRALLPTPSLRHPIVIFDEFSFHTIFHLIPSNFTIEQKIEIGRFIAEKKLFKEDQQIKLIVFLFHLTVAPQASLSNILLQFDDTYDAEEQFSDIFYRLLCSVCRTDSAFLSPMPTEENGLNRLSQLAGSQLTHNEYLAILHHTERLYLVNPHPIADFSEALLHLVSDLMVKKASGEGNILEGLERIDIDSLFNQYKPRALMPSASSATKMTSNVAAFFQQAAERNRLNEVYLIEKT